MKKKGFWHGAYALLRPCIIVLLLLQVGYFKSIASNIGDIVNYTVFSDIIVSINDYNIASYNIDGSTAIAVEDLREYGFNVVWKENERAIYVSRNFEKNDVQSIYITPQIPKSRIGKNVQMFYILI